MTRTEIETAHIRRQRQRFMEAPTHLPICAYEWQRLRLLARIYGRDERTVYLPSSDQSAAEAK
jgi:hypothetical protein